jgi:hypothetical protein
VSRIAEIVAFIRMARGGLAPETLGKAIRRRWPEASDAEIREAVERAVTETPNDAEERTAMEAVATALLGRPR